MELALDELNPQCRKVSSERSDSTSDTLLSITKIPKQQFEELPTIYLTFLHKIRIGNLINYLPL